MSKIDLIEKIVDGEHISPVLPDDIKNYLIDIDGTICDDIPNEEPERMATAKLYPDALSTLNKWYNLSNTNTRHIIKIANIGHIKPPPSINN